MSTAAARVLVIGAGGLGCAVIDALARAGVPGLTVCDDDVVDLSNLHRQLLHRSQDVGCAKVESVVRAMKARGPGVEIRPLRVRVTAENLAELAAGHDIVIDATDGPRTKFVLNDGCVRARKVLIHGGALGVRGQVTTVMPDGPCLRCVFEEPPENAPGTCDSEGVLGPVVGVIGAIQAAEALKILHGVGRPLTGRLLSYDADGPRFRTIRFRKSARCRGCGGTEVGNAA